MKTKFQRLLICLLGIAILSMANAQSPTSPAEAMRQRIIAKVERVKDGVHTWAASGRDPSAMVKTLQGTIKPLLDAGKAFEAEAELDRLLDTLNRETKVPANRPIVRNHTARADPAATRVARADSITTEPRRSISRFRRPGAVSGSSDRRELLQTSSASDPVAWAGVVRIGRIS